MRDCTESTARAPGTDERANNERYHFFLSFHESSGILIYMLALMVAFLLLQVPVPEKLAFAKTAYLINDGVSVNYFDGLAKELVKWKRFALVTRKEEADVIIVLSSKDNSTTALIPVGGSVFGVGGYSDIYLRIIDAGSGDPLWADKTDDTNAWTSSGPAKTFIGHLRPRLEKKLGAKK